MTASAIACRVTSSATYGYSLRYIRSQPPPHTVTASATYGYSLRYNTVTASATYGHSLRHIRSLTASATYGYSLRQTHNNCSCYFQRAPCGSLGPQETTEQYYTRKNTQHSLKESCLSVGHRLGLPWAPVWRQNSCRRGPWARPRAPEHSPSPRGPRRRRCAPRRASLDPWRGQMPPRERLHVVWREG